jgi:hypothetical protein
MSLSMEVDVIAVLRRLVPFLTGPMEHWAGQDRSDGTLGRLADGARGVFAGRTSSAGALVSRGISGADSDRDRCLLPVLAGTPPGPETAASVRTDRKITYRKWVRGSGRGPGVVIRPGQGRYRSGGFGDGDGEAEGLDLPDVVAQLALGVEAGLVIAVPELPRKSGELSR